MGRKETGSVTQGGHRWMFTYQEEAPPPTSRHHHVIKECVRVRLPLLLQAADSVVKALQVQQPIRRGGVLNEYTGVMPARGAGMGHSGRT